LFSSIADYDGYPGASNMDGSVYLYRVGAGSKVNMDFPIDWDRLHIILPGA